MQESVKSQIEQKSDEIAAITQKYDGQLAHLKNQSEESARAITLAMTQRVNSTESRFTQEL
jgi:hypothetical protein